MCAPLPVQRILKAGLGESADGSFCVVHAHDHAGAIKVVHGVALWGSAALWGVHQLHFAGPGDHQIRGTVLVSKGVPARTCIH